MFSGAVPCSQCKGNGINSVDHFNGQFKAGDSCWLCGYCVFLFSWNYWFVFYIRTIPPTVCWNVWVNSNGSSYHNPVITTTSRKTCHSWMWSTNLDFLQWKEEHVVWELQWSRLYRWLHDHVGHLTRISLPLIPCEKEKKNREVPCCKEGTLFNIIL